MLAGSGITVRFGGLLAVDDVSVEVPPGELRGLIGPNGAGKTTLLGALSGTLVPERGRVTMDGSDVTHVGLSGRARLGLGRTFQRQELFRNLTVFENLLVGAEARFGETDFIMDLTGRSRRGAAEELARSVLERLGLETEAGRVADEVPLGVGRLVEIGRALCTEPTYLLLDEPASGLDDDETDRVGALLRELADGGLGILLVEHDVDLVMEVCGHVTVLDFGRMIAEGPAADVRGDATVQAAYLGEEVDDAGAARGA